MRNIFTYLIIILFLFQCKTGDSSLKKATIKSLQPVHGELIGNPLDEIGKKQDELGVLLEFDTLETFTLDLNEDHKEDIIEVKRIKQWNDPGDFHLITINISGQKKRDFLNTSGWVAIGDYETQYVKDLVSNSLITSKYIAVQQASKNDILLFCFGYTYASQPGLLSIINLLMQNDPELIFNDNYHLYKFDDINKDGGKDIIVSKVDKEEINKESTLSSYELLNGWFSMKQDL